MLPGVLVFYEEYHICFIYSSGLFVCLLRFFCLSLFPALKKKALRNAKMKLPKMTFSGSICSYPWMILSFHHKAVLYTAINTDKLINPSWVFLFWSFFVDIVLFSFIHISYRECKAPVEVHLKSILLKDFTINENLQCFTKLIVFLSYFFFVLFFHN